MHETSSEAVRQEQGDAARRVGMSKKIISFSFVVDRFRLVCFFPFTKMNLTLFQGPQAFKMTECCSDSMLCNNYAKLCSPQQSIA